jgi:ketosteroid isomerase-like protein
VSQENVEIVQRIYEEINVRLEFPPEWFDPDCVTDWTDVAPDAQLIRGIDATNALIGAYFGTFENFHVTVDEVMYADQQRVVVAIRDRGQMKGSDVQITSQYCHVWTLRDGKVVRLSSHADKAGALKAVGLSE